MNDANAEQFEAYRPLMFSIAYRMLGSVTDAEDIVQKAYLRYQAAVPDAIVSHKAFLGTVVTRLCLNHLQLARVQREHYIGTWLPEPLLTAGDGPFSPPHQIEIQESLSIAFLTLLEQLTPLERAVFLLHEVFDYDYAEIAAILGKEEAACRQLLSRAKQHISDHRPRFRPEPEARRQMLDRFVQSVSSGDMEGLLQLLSEDVTMWADGGGKVRGAIARPLQGREAVARFVASSTRFLDEPARAEVVEVNGEPALILRIGQEVRLVVSISLDAGGIKAIRVIGNPDKLAWLNRADDENGKADS